MRRHEVDFVSLVAGSLFLVVAGVHVVAGASDTELDLRWTVPTLLVLLGVVGILGALRGTRPEVVDDTVAETVARDGSDGRSDDQTEVPAGEEGTAQP